MTKLQFTEQQRDILYHLGQCIIIPGRVFPPFSRDVVTRIESYLQQTPPHVLRMYANFLMLLERGAWTRYFKPMSRLNSKQRHDYVTSWQQGSVAKRTIMKALVAPIKVNYYDDPGLFEQLGLQYGKPPVKVETDRWQERITAGKDIHEDLQLECEVVVVGSGAGGAVVAAELAEKGDAVILVERGDYFDRSHFSGRPFAMMRDLYVQQGLLGTVGNAYILAPAGRTVGGTTTVNSGTCLRPPRRTLRRWREEYGLTEYAPDKLEAYFRSVESIYQVAPAKAEQIGKNGEIIARGAQRLGYRHGPLPRNAPDCDGQGVCPFGCPTDAKRSTNVSYVPRALKQGASLLTGVEVNEIIIKNGQPTGIRGFCCSSGRQVTINAKIVVLALGAYFTPLLLMKQKLGNSSGQLGRNLSIHPSTGVGALMAERLNASNCIPQGYMVDEFEEEGIMFEGSHMPMDLASLIYPGFGSPLQQTMEAYERLSLFGLMIEDSTRGVIRPRKDGLPLIRYMMNRNDVALMQRGIGILCRIYLEAGALQVVAPVHGWKTIRSASDLEANLSRKLHAWDLDMSAYHPLGSCHMGGDRTNYVCSPDGELYDMPNVFVCDGSAIPPALGVNPMITISAVAARNAEVIHSRL